MLIGNVMDNGYNNEGGFSVNLKQKAQCSDWTSRYSTIAEKEQRSMSYDTDSSIQSQEPRSTLAPSEKHLEDWICTTPHFIKYGAIERVVARQVVFPSGRCDVIAIVPIPHQRTIAPCMTSLSVIEIKKGAIDSHTLAQCLRYMRDLKEIYMHVRYPAFTEDQNIYDGYTDGCIFTEANGIPSEISGMIIGHSCSDPNILIACEAAGIQVYFYKFENDFYEFEAHYPENIVQRHTWYSEMAYAPLGQAMHDVIQRRFAVQKEGKE